MAPSHADVVTLVEGGQTFIGNVKPAVIWLCENGVAPPPFFPCLIDPNDNSDMTIVDQGGTVVHTGISDEFLIATGFDCLGNPLPSVYGVGCSDTQPVADNDDGPAKIFPPNVVAPEEGAENGVERVIYVALPGQPGGPLDPRAKPIVYVLISDTPEPASVILFGSIVAAVAGSLRLRRSSTRH